MNRQSTPRRVTAAIAVGLAIVLWFAAVFIWTTTTRLTSAQDFADVTVQTIQSPEGSEAVANALMNSADSYAASQGYDLTATGRDQIAAQLTDVIQGAEFPALLGPAIEQAREAYRAAPDGPITIDFSALRPLAVEKVQQINPALVKAIPPDADLTVTVQKEDIPPVASTIAGATTALAWLPLWLLLGVLVLGALALWASGDRPRMLRVLGIGSLVVALVPLVLRLAVPPITSSFAPDGTPSDLVSVGTVSILGNWWTALVVCVVVGVVLLGAGIWARRSGASRQGPLVLGR